MIGKILFLIFVFLTSDIDTAASREITSNTPVTRENMAVVIISVKKTIDSLLPNRSLAESEKTIKKIEQMIISCQLTSEKVVLLNQSTNGVLKYSAAKIKE